MSSRELISRSVHGLDGISFLKNSSGIEENSKNYYEIRLHQVMLAGLQETKWTWYVVCGHTVLGEGQITVLWVTATAAGMCTPHEGGRVSCEAGRGPACAGQHPQKPTGTEKRARHDARGRWGLTGWRWASATAAGGGHVRVLRQEARRTRGRNARRGSCAAKSAHQRGRGYTMRGGADQCALCLHTGGGRRAQIAHPPGVKEGGNGETQWGRKSPGRMVRSAWAVCSLAEPTGHTWPLHDVRISPAYPCTPLASHLLQILTPLGSHRSRALTPINVLARRTRLSFFNAHAALEALPRVADIMAAELHWSRADKARHIRNTIAFLASMGLVPAAAAAALSVGLRERAAHTLWGAARAPGLVSYAPQVAEYSRAKFDSAEIAALKGAFARNAQPVAMAGPAGAGAGQEVRLAKAALGAEGGAGDTEYVLEKAGFKARADVDFDEFLEICGSLKEVSFAPAPSKQERLTIPVEKSGGGV
ncbi:hypothetical protein DFH08DRAFT_807587 [Mycena albidolilacea]|uniref:glycerol-3-phosphate dehydrogenase n=1 Tax=Mycena albidolilacea TaxID=1033008 RepID=A0AAD7ESU2_9AGAR|nr:hypothetical protein DFH08DRAFT_807587 [Mycena albidolilacea]